MAEPVLFRVTQIPSFLTGVKQITGASCQDLDGRSVVIPEESRGRTWRDCLSEDLAVPVNQSGHMLRCMLMNHLCAQLFAGDADEILPVVFDRIKGPPAKKSGNPEYAAIRVHAGVRLRSIDPGFHTLGIEGPASVPDVETWDGGHFVRPVEGNQSGVYCSRAFLEAARTENWTGFEFHPADAPLGLQLLWDGIDYLGERWPPQRWYPPDATSFRGVEDWVAAFDDVGIRSGLFVSVMVRERERWADQSAIDWLQSFITEHPKGSRRVDRAAQAYLQTWGKLKDRFHFDTEIIEHARAISIEVNKCTSRQLAKRHGPRS